MKGKPSLSDMISLAAVPVPLILLDADAHVLRCNIPAQEALGTSERKLIGRHITDLFSPKVEIENLFARLTP